MTTWRPALLLLLLPVCAAAEAPTSVAVRTEPARRGTAPALVIAYGAAAPMIGGSVTLSLQQDGQVATLAVAPGAAVAAGETLLVFQPSPAAASAYRQALSALALARSQRAHAAQLRRQSLATQDQLDQADKAVSDAAAAMAALQAQGAGEAAPRLAAPFDGVVASLAVGQGDRVAAGAPLLVLTRADGVGVSVGIEPDARDAVKRGAPAVLAPLAGGAAVTGTVLRVGAALNPRTRLIDADIAVPPGSVLLGAAFRAAITTGQISGWRVAHDAVIGEDADAALFQVRDDKAVRVGVRVLAVDGDHDIVAGQLDPALPVVAEGAAQLDDGDAVRQSEDAPPP